MRSHLLLALPLLAACTSLRGGARVDPYGGPPAGAPAVRFAPGALPEGKVFASAFTPDGRTVFFTLRDRSRNTLIELWSARFDGARWVDAGPAPVARGWPAMDPFITRDGRRLYFSWAKPRAGMRADTVADYDTWMSERQGDGSWGEARHVGDAPHSPQGDFYPAVTSDGTLYFDSMRPGLPARRNVWRARLVNGAYGAAEPLPAAVNDPQGGAANPYVDPQERYIIFGSSRPGGQGRQDLWISWRGADGSWGTPVNLGPRVNGADTEFCPMVSPDGKWLLFSRIRFEGNQAVADDPYIVSVDVVEATRR